MAEFEIPRFDDPLPVDRVIFAIRPVDSFTGGTVRGSVEARIKALGVRARRNLTGLLVFVNLDARPTYDVQIEARAAGFFDVDISVPRPADDASDAQRLQPVQLQPLPTAPFTHETTLVRGVVARAGAAIADVRIEAVEQGLVNPTVFRSRSDPRGAFVLPLRLAPSNASPDSQPSAAFVFTFKADGLPDRELPATVVDGVGYRFGVLVELQDPVVSPLLLPSGL
jgi:hypothetical protein